MAVHTEFLLPKLGRYHAPRSLSINVQETNLLQTITGQSFSRSQDPHFANAIALLNLLRRRTELLVVPQAIFSDSIKPGANASWDSVVHLMSQAGKCLKDNTQISGDEVIAMAVENGLLQEQCLEPGQLRDVSRRLVYAIVACLTMLFVSEALEPEAPQSLLVSVQKAKETAISSLAVSEAQRPILETLTKFNEVLPISPPNETHSEPTGLLHVSNLNASTLTQIGGIKIRWVTCIGSHLDFDFLDRRLALFSFPTFCHLHTLGDSVFSCVVEDYYDE